MTSNPNRYSVETDSTIRDIWTLSQRQSSEFNPQQIREDINRQRQIRRDVRAGGESENIPSMTGLLMGDSPVPRQEAVSRAMKRHSVNLKKTMALLDEAVGSPSSPPRTGQRKNTPMQLRHTSYTPKPIPSGSRFDASSVLGASIVATPGSMLSMNENSRSRHQFSTTQFNTSGNESRSTPDNVTSNVAVMLEEDPTIPECNSLYAEFMQTMQQHRSDQQLFQLLEDYETLCQDNVTLLKKLSTSTIPGHHKSGKMLDMYELLNQEMCTWRLVAALCKDRLETELKAEEQPMNIDTTEHESEQQLTKQLYERDTSVRQAQLVIDWLERNAADSLDDYYDRVEFFLDSNGGNKGGAAWENTLHELKHEGVGGGRKKNTWSGGQLVTQLDPDAPIRQRRELADLDMEDEARLIKYLFAHIRAGKLQEAQELCHKVGQPWRAATLEGWRLYHDPNYSTDASGGEIQPIQGNHFRNVWKNACWNMAEQERLSVHERALYAAYSGNLSRLLPACDSWMDYVWAYLRVHVDQRVEEELQLHANTCGRPETASTRLPSQFMEKMMTLENIFQEIQSSPNDCVRVQSAERYAVVQRYVIEGDVPGLLEEMFEWSRPDMDPPPQLLRFMAHLVLFFCTVGSTSTMEELCISILEAYVRHLMSTNETSLVATYVAALPQDIQVDCYANFLEGIRGTEARKEVLSLGEEAGLNLHAITRTVVENVRKKHSPADFILPSSRNKALPHDTGTITEADQEKIDALEWLVFDPAQRAEAMKQANALMRSFLSLKKLTATKAALDMLPEDSIDVIVRLAKIQEADGELGAEDDNTVREYLCIRTYLDSHDSFNDWFSHYQHSQPSSPDPVSASATFTERVAHEHRHKQYTADLERWRHALKLQTETTVEKLYNVLLFPNGGWMVDTRDDGAADETRALQLRPLRELCLPEIAVLLHTVLHATQQYKRALQLADVIAAETNQLYMIFRKEELKKLMQKFRESSVALLDENKDPMGYTKVQTNTTV